MRDTTLPGLREDVTPSRLHSTVQGPSSSSHAFLKTCPSPQGHHYRSFRQIDMDSEVASSASGHVGGIDSWADGFIKPFNQNLLAIAV